MESFANHSHKAVRIADVAIISEVSDKWTLLKANYEKIYDSFDETIENVIAKVKRIMPKYSVLTIGNYDKKISNTTLNKVYNYPYIVIL